MDMAMAMSDARGSDATGSDSRASDATGSDSRAGDGGGADAQVLNAQQAKGKYLVDHVVGCPDCHTPRDATGAPIFAKYMSGAECFFKAPNGDCLNSRNLTNDETGLKNRSDADIKKMFQDGLRPSATGDQPLNPVMPYYVFHNMKAEDADAIVAYLRTIPAVNHTVPRSGAFWDVTAAAKPLDPAKIPAVADTDPNKDSANHGRYLATMSGVCIECHTKHLAPGSATVLDEANFFAGGEIFDLGIPWDPNPVSRNITSDPDNGVGKWTAADVIKVLKEGKEPDGHMLCPPMPFGPMGPYGGLMDADATDIANYIKSLPANKNKVAGAGMCIWPPPPPPDGGMMSTVDGGADATSSPDSASDM